MKGKLIIIFPVGWMVWAIWQGCQVKGQTINKTLRWNKSPRTYFHSFPCLHSICPALGDLPLSIIHLKTQSV